MSFKKQTFKNYLLHDTPVDNLFIADYAKNAPGDYVKVYLLALMYANNEENCDNAKLGKVLGLSETKVAQAFHYWQEQGIVRIYSVKNGNPNDFDVEFLCIRDEAFGRSIPAMALQSSTKKLDDEKLSDLFRNVETVTGRFLESREPAAIAGWVQNFEIDPDVILLAYKFCTEGKTSNRCAYVEKVLMDWRGRGLSSVSDVEGYLEDTDRRYDFYRTVCKELGFLRNPTEPEKRMMNSWIDDFGFTKEQVLEACKKTTGISNPNLNYVDSVLRSSQKKESEQAEPARSTNIDEYYAKLRAFNNEKTKKRREEIYTMVPRLREIADELRSSGYKASRCILMGASGKDALEQERRKQRSLNAEKESLLSQYSYPADALDQIYSCPKCHDTGRLDDGRSCECYLKIISDRYN